MSAEKKSAARSVTTNDYKGSDLSLSGILFVLGMVFPMLLGGLFFYPLCFAFIIGPARPLFRTISSFTQNLMLSMGVFAIEKIGGTKIRIFSNQRLKAPLNCFVISNHRTRLDWLYLWCLFFRLGLLNSIKIVAKADMRSLPLIGWAMQVFGFFFVRRDWVKDKQYLTDAMNTFTEVEDAAISPVLFPEGTDLHPKAKEASNVHARENNLPEFDYVIHPRTKGFSHMLQGVRAITPVVCDVTIGYKDYTEGERPNEKSLLAGQFSKEVHFFVRFFDMGEVPVGEKELQQWLTERWVEKEARLKKFYENHQNFTGTYEMPLSALRGGLLWLAGGVMIMLTTLCIKLLITDSLWRWWCLFCMVFFHVASKLGGIDMFNIKMHKFIQSKLPSHMKHKPYVRRTVSVPSTTSTSKPKNE